MEESEENNTPPELKESAKSTTANLVPESSKRQYETAYEKFADWLIDMLHPLFGRFFQC